MSAMISLEVKVSEGKLIEAFRRLSARQRIELLGVLRALCEPELRTVPVSRLNVLTGIVSPGGDALADTEAIYDGDNGH